MSSMIVYGDIKIYRSNVKTLRFLEKLHSASATQFALQLGNQATDRFHFLPAAQLHIGIPISGLISIFIKCAMCRVIAQRVTYTQLSLKYVKHDCISSCSDFQTHLDVHISNGTQHNCRCLKYKEQNCKQLVLLPGIVPILHDSLLNHMRIITKVRASYIDHMNKEAPVMDSFSCECFQALSSPRCQGESPGMRLALEDRASVTHQAWHTIARPGPTQ